MRTVKTMSVTKEASAGFTLIEVMITIAIIGTLAAIALPSYNDYILRGKLIEASNTLTTMRTTMEQYYQDNRTYLTVTSGTIDSPCTTPTVNTGLKYFSVSCTVLTPTAYTLKASGLAGTPTANFYYTIDEASKQTSVVNAAWGGGAINNCWIMKKGSTC